MRRKGPHMRQLLRHGTSFRRRKVLTYNWWICDGFARATILNKVNRSKMNSDPELNQLSAESGDTKPTRKFRNVWALWSLPWVWLGICLLYDPGNSMPPFGDSNCCLILCLMFIWESGGCFLLSRFSHLLMWILVILFCVIPAFLTAMCFPYLEDILKAIGI